MNKEWYVWMELIGDGPKFKGKYDSWLCPWNSYESFLTELLETEEVKDEPPTVRFSLFCFNDEELREFAEQEGLDDLDL